MQIGPNTPGVSASTYIPVRNLQYAKKYRQSQAIEPDRDVAGKPVALKSIPEKGTHCIIHFLPCSMDEDFMLPVSFQGNESVFPAKILQRGFMVQLAVEINGTTVTFEPDEERNWRAVLGFEDLLAGKTIKKELLEAIALKITAITQ